MTWTINLSDTAIKHLSKIDKTQAKRIINYLENLASLANPRTKGKALTGDKTGIWCYRVGNYRLLCDIEEQEITILVLSIGHRKEIYK